MLTCPLRASYTFKVQATDLAGNVSTPVVYQFSVGATAAPSITQAPKPTLVGLNSTAGPLLADATKGVPVTIAWAGTACVSGATSCNVDHYVLQESINGLAFSTVTLPSPTASSVVRTLKVSPTNNSVPATTYRYQVQAVDKAGHVSAFSLAPSFTVPDVDNGFGSSFSGAWSGLNLAGAFGGSVQQSSTANATANPANAQAVTSLAVVSTLGPDRGIAQIKVDGTAVATVDLYAPSLQPAQIVWAANGLAAGSNHQVQMVVTGTRNAAASAARVDYDAVLGLK